MLLLRDPPLNPDLPPPLDFCTLSFRATSSARPTSEVQTRLRHTTRPAKGRAAFPPSPRGLSKALKNSNAFTRRHTGVRVRPKLRRLEAKNGYYARLSNLTFANVAFFIDFSLSGGGVPGIFLPSNTFFESKIAFSDGYGKDSVLLARRDSSLYKALAQL